MLIFFMKFAPLMLKTNTKKKIVKVIKNNNNYSLKSVINISNFIEQKEISFNVSSTLKKSLPHYPLRYYRSNN